MSDQSHRGNSFAKLRRIGVLSWSVLGVVALVVVIATALGALSGIIIPLLIAIIIGTLLEPLVVGLENRGLKTPFPSIIGLFTAILVLIGIFAIIGWGIIQQLPEIYQQLNAGWNSLVVWGRSLDIDSVWLVRVRSTSKLMLLGLLRVFWAHSQIQSSELSPWQWDCSSPCSSCSSY